MYEIIREQPNSRELNSKRIPNVHNHRNTLILIIGLCYTRFFILVVVRIIKIHYNENLSYQNAFHLHYLNWLYSNYLGTKKSWNRFSESYTMSRFHVMYYLLNSVACEADHCSNVGGELQERRDLSITNTCNETCAQEVQPLHKLLEKKTHTIK